MPVRVGVRVRESDVAAVRRALGTVQAPGLERPTRRFLLSAGFLLLTNAAREQIIGGGRVRVGRGLTSTPPHPSRLTSRSGELRRSLSADRGADTSGLPRWIDVGSDLAYAPTHELGLRGYPVRAFLRPAGDAVSPGFAELYARELERELATVGGYQA